MSGTKNPFEDAVERMKDSKSLDDIDTIFQATVFVALDTLTYEITRISHRLDRIETYLQGKEPIEREEEPKC